MKSTSIVLPAAVSAACYVLTKGTKAFEFNVYRDEPNLVFTMFDPDTKAPDSTPHYTTMTPVKARRVYRSLLNHGYRQA